MLKSIEQSGRVCYKSEKKITKGSAEDFVKKIIKSGHLSVIEHQGLTVKFVVDRGVSHELVRHRIISCSQESSRYCNYNTGCQFIIPPWVDYSTREYKCLADLCRKESLHTHEDFTWCLAMLGCEQNYLELLKSGWTPQQARAVLPNSLKTEIDVTANLREWRHILKLRTSKAAHPQMREVMCPLLDELKSKMPVIFYDIDSV